MKVALLTLLLAGCDVVFSLDRPPGSDAADAPPPGPDIATATFIHTHLSAPGDIEIVPAGDDITASVVLENGARPEVIRDGGDFRFAWTRGMTYHVTFQRPGRGPLEYVSNAEHLVHAQRDLYGATAAIPAAGSQLDVVMTNVAGVALTYVMSTGVWTHTNSAGQMVNNVHVDWTAPGAFLTGRPRLLRAEDALYCSGFADVTDGTGEGNLSYTALDRRHAVTTTMANGVPTPVACDLENIPLDRCARIASDRTAELARVMSVGNPTFSASTSYSTYVLAVAERSFGPSIAFWLAYQQGAVTPPTPFAGTLHYANPFPGQGPAVLSSIVRQRTLLAAGASKALTLSAGTQHYYEPTENCGAVTPLADIAMSSPPAIGGALLVQDTELQLSQTRPIELSWEDRTTGPVDYYIITLSRLVEGATDETLLDEVKTWVTTEKTLTIERTLFDSDHSYIIAITTHYGVPTATTGDFSTTRWPSPVSAATNFSSVFTVAP